MQLEWGRGRVFDAEIGTMFQQLVSEAKQVGGNEGFGAACGTHGQRTQHAQHACPCHVASGAQSMNHNTRGLP